MSTLNLFVIACFVTNVTNLPSLPNKITLFSQEEPVVEKEYRTVILPDTARVSVPIEKITECRISVSTFVSFEQDKFPDSLFSFLIDAGLEEDCGNPFGYIGNPVSNIPAEERVRCDISFSREQKYLFVYLGMPYGTFKQEQTLTFGDLRVVYCPDQQLIKSVVLKKTSLISDEGNYNYVDHSNSLTVNIVTVRIGGICARTTFVGSYSSIYPKGTNLRQVWNLPQHTVSITQSSGEKPSFEYKMTCSQPGELTAKTIDTCVQAVTSRRQLVLSGLIPIDQYEDETSITTTLEPTVITLELQSKK